MKNIISKLDMFKTYSDSNIVLNDNTTYYMYFDSLNDINILVKENVCCNIVMLNDTPYKQTINICASDNSNVTLINICNYSDSVTIYTKPMKGAYINSMMLSISGASNVKQIIDFDERKASCDSYNVIINSSCAKQTFTLETNHNVGDTKSQMTNYCICKNASSTTTDTVGYIKLGAKDANISQKTKGIILDETSSISANPILKIDEFDCLASHGAGIGAIDEEDLFYLMSRGLTRSESEKLIIFGFVNVIYEQIENEKLREEIINIVSKIL